MKKLTVVIMISLLAVTLLSGFAAAETNSKFQDTKGHWAEATIGILVDLNLVDGFPDGSFRPNATVQRDQFLKLTLVVMGHRLEEGNSYWAQPYIDLAIEKNLITSNEFNAYNVPISREEMASVIVKATLNSEAAPTEPADMDILSNVKDFHSIKDSYKQSALEAYRFGLITGKKVGYYSPLDNSTRAEASTVIARYLDPTLRIPYVVPPDKLHIVLEDVNDRKYIFSEGTFIKVYAPKVSVDGGPEVEIDDVIETALVLQNTISTMEKGYGEIKVNRDEGVITSTFFNSAESIYRDDQMYKLEDKVLKDANVGRVEELNMWFDIKTGSWGEERFSPYVFRVAKFTRTNEYNREVVENIFRHLFASDYDKAIQKYDEILNIPASSENHVENVIYNGRKVHIIIFTTGTIEFYVTEIR